MRVPLALAGVNEAVETPAPTQLRDTARGLRRDALQVAPVLAKKAAQVAKQSGGRVYTDGDQYLCDAPGVRIKERGRQREKAVGELGGRHSQVCDIAAITIVFDNQSALYAGHRAAMEAVFGAENIVRRRDSMVAPRSNGYGDISYNVRLPNGHIAEVQLHVAPMLWVKQVEQVLYNERRAMGAITTASQLDRLAYLEGAAAAMYWTARQAIEQERDLTDDERWFVRSFVEPKQ